MARIERQRDSVGRLARLARAERIKACARECDEDHHPVIDGTSVARKRGGSLGDQCGREKDQGEPAQLDFGRFSRIGGQSHASLS
jgi:hypothetical protein